MTKPRPVLAVDVHQWAKDLDQLIGERDAERARADALARKVAAVEALHSPRAFPRHGGPHHGKQVCRECSSKGWDGENPGEPWPCATAAVLAGAVTLTAEQPGPAPAAATGADERGPHCLDPHPCDNCWCAPARGTSGDTGSNDE